MQTEQPDPGLVPALANPTETTNCLSSNNTPSPHPTSNGHTHLIAEQHQPPSSAHPHYANDHVVVDMVALQNHMTEQPTTLFDSTPSSGGGGGVGDSTAVPTDDDRMNVVVSPSGSDAQTAAAVSPNNVGAPTANHNGSPANHLQHQHQQHLQQQQHHHQSPQPRSTTPIHAGSPAEALTPRSRPAPEGEEGEEGEERDKKRQRRLLQNRQSAALSRQRKKEYLGGLERRNNELDAENKVLKQTVYTNDARIRELEGRLAFFIKQNEDLKNLLRSSDKVDDMNRLLAQAYSSLALQTAGINVSGLLGLGFLSHELHSGSQGALTSSPSSAQPPSTGTPSPPTSAHAAMVEHLQYQPPAATVSVQQQQQQQQQHLPPAPVLLKPESDGGSSQADGVAPELQLPPAVVVAGQEGHQ